MNDHDDRLTFIADSILGAASLPAPKHCRSLLVLLLSRDPINLGDALRDLEFRQVSDLTRHLAELLSVAPDAEAIEIAELSSGDQLLVAIELRDKLERWAMSSWPNGEPSGSLAGTRENLRDYFLSQQGPEADTATALDMFNHARDLDIDRYAIGTRSFLSVMSRLLTAADKGHATACTVVGYYFAECGDYRRYLMWSLRGARRGSGGAWFNLGTSYMRGVDGLPKDYKAALKCFLKADKYGCESSGSEIGRCYIRLGKYAEAKQWLERALRERTDEYAYSLLGELYERGWGVKKSNRVALEYYRSAGAMGLEFAQRAAERLRISPTLADTTQSSQMARRHVE